MIKYYVLFAIAIVLCVTYALLYGSRLNKSKDHDQKKRLRLAPRQFIALVLIVSLSLGLSSALYDRFNLEKELIESGTDTIGNTYLEDETRSRSVLYVASEYLIHFGGTYVDDGRTIICITHDAPEALITYLTSNNIPYEYVSYSYNDLLSVYQLIVRDSKDMDGFLGIGIDERMNTVIVDSDQVATLNERYQTYVDENILEIRPSDGLTYRD